MDGNRFDEITRSLATPSSRRRVLRNLGTGIVGTLTALGLRNADAAPGGKGKGGGNRCGGPGQPCKWNKQCCEFSGLVCLDGACTCPENTCASGACHGGCPAGKVFDAETCSCVCAEAPTCNDRQVLNPETCTCDCAPCPAGKLLDSQTCACMCPQTNNCGTCYNPQTEEVACIAETTHSEWESYCAGLGMVSSSWDDSGVIEWGCGSEACYVVCNSDFPSFPD